MDMKHIEKELFNAVKQCVSHPNGVVCKHWAAIQIIQAMDNIGISFKSDERYELVSAIVDAKDEISLPILEKESK